MATRKEIKAAFEVALERLERTRDYGSGHLFICHALTDHRSDLSIGTRAARDIVLDRLGGYKVVEDWLQSKGINLSKASIYEEMLDYRIRWVKELIREFS